MPSTPAPRFRSAVPALAAALLLSAAAAPPANADRPVTRQGARAETGVVHAEATAEQAQVILYSTAWCGYCKKTRELLHSLEVPFIEKDIEKSEEGRAEHRAKGKGYRGVPLTDIAGTLVKGYLPEEIKRLVTELQKESAGAPAR